MTYVRSSTVAITTATSGAATVYSDAMNGSLNAIKVVAAGTTSTADITITGETSGFAMLTKANITKSATSVFYPRAPAHTVAAGATTSAVVLVAVPVFDERIKLVMAQGGNAQSYTVTYYVV